MLHCGPCSHRGSGASKVQGHAVRENTLLSFQKAALNHSEFIEFDVSWHWLGNNKLAVAQLCVAPTAGWLYQFHGNSSWRR